MEYCEQAREKLADEEKSFSGGQKEKIVYRDVSRTLQSFCSEEWFANAILQSAKTLSDCCKEIMSHVSGSGVSDFEVYKRAVEYYFPTATVKFKMEITLNDQKEDNPGNGQIISLLDLI